MTAPQAQRQENVDWLQLDPSLVPERMEDLAISSLRMLQLNGRFLYIKRLPALAEFNPDEFRVLDVLSRQGDTVFVTVGEDGGLRRLSYRMPDLENAIAFDLEGLRGLIRQWFVWASTAAA